MSDFNAQICMERMIASLTGPPPPDFDQLIREKCFGELIERRVQQQIQEQTFQETRDAETGEVVPIEEPIRESDASTFTEPILEPVETVPPPPAEETRDTEETTSTEQPTPVSDFAGAVVNGGKIFIDAARSLLGLWAPLEDRGVLNVTNYRMINKGIQYDDYWYPLTGWALSYIFL